MTNLSAGVAGLRVAEEELRAVFRELAAAKAELAELRQQVSFKTGGPLAARSPSRTEREEG